MALLKKLTLKLKSGLLTELHSDTIMGHFCWRMLDRFDINLLKEFISYYSDENLPMFTISNGLLEKNGQIYFTKPLIHYLNKNNQEDKFKKFNVIEFLKNKQIKSLDLISETVFKNFINGEINNVYNILMNEKIEIPEIKSELRVSVEIDRNTLRSKEGQLFSYHPLYFEKDTNLVILIKIINEDLFFKFKCDEILRDVFEIGYGKKKSSGFGQFEVLNRELEDFEVKEPNDANAFICLGNYLPSVYDNISKDSYYDFIIKYGRLGEEKSLSANPFKKPLIMFTPGSIFKTSNIKEYYGRVTQSGDISEFDLDVVQFGIPLTLNMKIS